MLNSAVREELQSRGGWWAVAVGDHQNLHLCGEICEICMNILASLSTFSTQLAYKLYGKGNENLVTHFGEL